MSTEATIQRQCVLWFNRKYPKHRKRLVHIYNNPPNAIKGAQLKAQGLQAGIPDLMLLLPNGRTVFIEMKTEKGRLSPNQKEYESLLKSSGFDWYLCRSLGSFIEIVENYNL